MATGDAGDGSKMTRARSDGRGRKPREQGTGASNSTAGSSFIRPEAEMRLLKVILGRDNDGGVAPRGGEQGRALPD